MSLFILSIFTLSIIIQININKKLETLIFSRIENQVDIFSKKIESLHKNKIPKETIIKILQDNIYSQNIKDFPENLNINLEGKGFIFIFDKEGTLIVHPAFQDKNLIEKIKGTLYNELHK